MNKKAKQMIINMVKLILDDFMRKQQPINDLQKEILSLCDPYELLDVLIQRKIINPNYMKYDNYQCIDTRTNKIIF